MRSQESVYLMCLQQYHTLLKRLGVKNVDTYFIPIQQLE